MVKTKRREVIDVPVDQIVPHPDNYRAVRTETPQFQDLLESIRACGVIEPVLVRPHRDGNERLQSCREALELAFYELLSGHRRWTAARMLKLATIPAIDRGALSDAEAFDVMCLANLHEELTPLEEGRRAATWLDKYAQDARAVASKLGKTERWVHEHAQIARGLSADWQKAAVEMEGFAHWTASHWAVIAKLPVRIQAAELSKFRGHYCSFDRWSVKELESRVKLTTFLLTKAPFDTKSCAQCLARSGVQPLLWADAAADATGEKERCLDQKCWQRKCEKAARAKFKTLAADKGLEGAVPLSTLKEPRGYDYRKKEQYRQKLSAARRVHKGLVTAEHAQIVKKGTKGAVPAIVVAGPGQGAVKYVKYVKIKKDKAASRAGGASRTPTAAEIKRQKEADRWQTVCRQAWQKIRTSEIPSLPVQAFLILVHFSDLLYGADRESAIREATKQWAQGTEAFEQSIKRMVWATLCEMIDGMYLEEEDRDFLTAISPIFDLDLPALYAELVRGESGGAAGSGEAGEPREADVDVDTNRIVDPEVLVIDLPTRYKAQADIRVGCVEGAWYAGAKAHIPGAGLDLPVSITGCAFDSRAAAIVGMAGKIVAWLEARKGRKSYKHYDAVAATVQAFAQRFQSAERAGGAGAACDGDPAACRIGCQPCLADPQEKITKAAVERPTCTIRVPLPQSYQTEIEIYGYCLKGVWRGGYDLKRPHSRATLRLTAESCSSKADCLKAMVTAVLAEVPSKYRSRITARVEEAVAAELQKRTCRICGCTEDDCRQCIERTGAPCTWVADDLCSACQEVEP